MKVFVLIKTKINYELIAPDKIKNLPNVEEIILTTGSYDMIVRLEAERDDGIKATIKKIRLMKFILSTTTLVKTKGGS